MFWKSKKRGLIVNIIEDKCQNCGCCVKICRHRVLENAVVNGKSCTFVSRPEKCTVCGRCVMICPNQAIEMIERDI